MKRALIAAAIVALALPAVAHAHAYLVRTAPAASALVEHAPRDVALTYDEAVEPRFALISVTDVQGRQQTIGPPHRSPENPDTLVVPLKPGLPEGWYLIYWRAISVDGHPVSGAFTYAVGPNPGPAPQFVIPKLSASAKTPLLLITRTVMFLAMMISIGLCVMRLTIAGTIPETHRRLTRAFVAASVVGLVAIPVYLDAATANDSLRSVFDLGALVPLYSATAFGRGMLKLELCFALFCAASYVALWLDRPERRPRSVAELAAGAGALLAGVATLQVPGVIGHAGQTTPRGLSIAVDLVHLAAGSIWLGGLAGLLLIGLAPAGAGRLARAGAVRAVVQRFSPVALGSVIVLLATGTVATIVHMPAVNALWDTGYGQAILVKLGLLATAVAVASANLLRAVPQVAEEATAPAALGILRRTVPAEAVIVTGAVFVAALLSSLAPPPPSFALGNAALTKVGPGRVAATVERAGFRLQVLVNPNKAAQPDAFTLRITKDGALVTGAQVTLTFNQLDMQMPAQEYALKEIHPGVYSRATPALVMVGRWSLAFGIAPRGAPAFTALIVDQASG